MLLIKKKENASKIESDEKYFRVSIYVVIIQKLDKWTKIRKPM